MPRVPGALPGPTASLLWPQLLPLVPGEDLEGAGGGGTAVPPLQTPELQRVPTPQRGSEEHLRGLPEGLAVH